MRETTLLLTPEWQLLIAKVIGSLSVTAALVIFFWYPLQNLLAFVQPRKPGETWRKFFRRVQNEFYQEQDRKDTQRKLKRERDATRFGSRKKTRLVEFLNLTLLLGMAFSWIRFPASFWPTVGYLAVGLAVNRWLGVVQFEGLPPLKRSERRTLHLFYAWFWPLYVWAWRNARQQRG